MPRSIFPLWMDAMPSGEQALQLAYIDEQLNERLAVVHGDEHALLDVLFLKAVKTRIEGAGEPGKHIYLQEFEIPQIVLFDILIHKMPFVVYGHQIVNQKMAELLRSSRKAVVIDAGIGRGLQMAKLLESLQQPSLLEELTIIGIEVYADALAAAETTIRQASAGLSFRVKFIAVKALLETIAYDELQALMPVQPDLVLVNSAFTLHHLQCRSQREAFLGLAAQLGAHHIFLLEPHSDHFTDDWSQRVVNAYEHYGTIFRVIDQLAISEQERKGLKVFFGREIDDVVAAEDSSRYERHEPGSGWIKYLNDVGYRSVPLQRPGAAASVVRFQEDALGFLKMMHDEVTILSVLHGVKQ